MKVKHKTYRINQLHITYCNVLHNWITNTNNPEQKLIENTTYLTSVGQDSLAMQNLLKWTYATLLLPGFTKTGGEIVDGRLLFDR